MSPSISLYLIIYLYLCDLDFNYLYYSRFYKV